MLRGTLSSTRTGMRTARSSQRASVYAALHHSECRLLCNPPNTGDSRRWTSATSLSDPSDMSCFLPISTHPVAIRLSHRIISEVTETCGNGRMFCDTRSAVLISLYLQQLWNKRASSRPESGPVHQTTGPRRAPSWPNIETGLGGGAGRDPPAEDSHQLAVLARDPVLWQSGA